MVWLKTKGKEIPVALTIAGSDSGGGAGIQADLKTFAAVGVHGTAAITAITAQNTYSVTKVQDIDPEIVKEQIRVVVEDLGVNAAKTGMLHTPEIINAVADEVSKYDFPLVVDPVMIAKSGAPLLKAEAMDTLIKRIVPLATVITPNKYEAEKLAGMKIQGLDDAKEAARKIVKLGAKAVIVKGGHLGGNESIDILYMDGRYYEYKLPRIDTKNTHGTGCSFSAAIAGYLAKGESIPSAVKKAKKLVYYAIKYGLSIGRGHGPVNPMAILYRESEKYSVLRELWEAFKVLKAVPEVAMLIPETRSNFVYSIPEPEDITDIAGFPGRITVDENEIVVHGRPDFGVSSHMARAVMVASMFDPEIRSAMNIKYSERIVSAAIKAGFSVASFDRKDEPKEIREKEGFTLQWGISKTVREVGYVPDIVYDKGDIGKEPMIRIFGNRPRDIVRKIQKIIELL